MVEKCLKNPEETRFESRRGGGEKGLRKSSLLGATEQNFKPPAFRHKRLEGSNPRE